MSCTKDESTAIALLIAGWLHLAAAPTFTIMALSTLVIEGRQPHVLCGGNSVFYGMAPMYVLMALFHLTPWLKRWSRRHARWLA